MIKALQLAPAAVIQPFSYTLLLWAVIIGYVGFGDLPDRWTLARRRGDRRGRLLHGASGSIACAGRA